MDVFKILLATDNHLGYAEKDPIRGQDSFESFKEVFQIAKREKVDFVLLGGDLFHENKPSMQCLHKTITILRSYCMGDDPVYFQLMSDAAKNFGTNCHATLNVHDPNYNISLPVFSIHGNHDDPIEDNICALDLLSSTGIVNYFGKAQNPDDIKILPILLTKGSTKLALYGLGNIRDERLHRTFLRGNVQLLQPRDKADEWFNMFVIHQNRAEHGPKNHIPESFLHDFLDLVFWGHEHESIVEPSHNPSKCFYVTQPGSSVATSLSEGESRKKHVGILEIKGKEFKMKKVFLKTVRPFIMDNIILKNIPELQNTSFDQKAVESHLVKHVEKMIKQIMDTWLEDHGEHDGEFPLPLVRLKVEYTDCSTFNPNRFGLRFMGRVANPKDILNFYRSRPPFKLRSKTDKDDLITPRIPDQLEGITVENFIQEFVKSQEVEVLPEKKLSEALKKFVEKDSKDALKSYYDKNMKSLRQSAFEECSAQDLDAFVKDELKTLKIKQPSKNVQTNNSDDSSDDNESLVKETVSKIQRPKKRIDSDYKEKERESSPEAIYVASEEDDYLLEINEKEEKSFSEEEEDKPVVSTKKRKTTQKLTEINKPKRTRVGAETHKTKPLKQKAISFGTSSEKSTKWPPRRGK